MTRPREDTDGPPVVTGQDTVTQMLERSKRRNEAVPLRREFVQAGSRREPEPGPLADLVRHHDDRALSLYLLLHALASSEPWDVALPSAVWARALRLYMPDRGTAAISKTWQRLERLGLVARRRRGRLAQVTVLREDGSGTPYTHPGDPNDPSPYFQLPYAYWLAPRQWDLELSLPGKAMLLIGLSLPEDFWLPYQRAPEWYGISADTAEHGLKELKEAGLLTSRTEYKAAPLTATGYTEQRRYTLHAPFPSRRRPSATGANA